MYKTVSIFVLILTCVGIVSAQDEPTCDEIRQAVIDANDYGEILSYYTTQVNVDDHRSVPKFVHHLFSKVFGDKHYLSKPLADQSKGVYAA